MVRMVEDRKKTKITVMVRMVGDRTKTKISVRMVYTLQIKRETRGWDGRVVSGRHDHR